MEWGERDSKIRRRGQEVGFPEVLWVDLYLCKESNLENANKEGMGSCDWSEERICAKEGKDVSVVKRRERRDM